MNLVEFLQDISLKGVKLWCDGEKLRTGGSQEILTPDVISQLKQYKTQILQLLQEQPDILQVYPLSYGQKNMWFLWQLAPQSYHYNLSFAVRIYSQADITTWQQTFKLLRQRHPLLQSTFPKVGEQPVLQVHQNQELDFLQIDATNWSKDELHKKVTEAHRHPFKLDKEPVMRVRWFSCSEQEQVLLLTIHHIALDGWSINLIVKELPQLYQAQCTGVEASMPELNLSYQDYVSWQRKLVESPEGENLWNYWQQKLAGELPVLNLPTDRPRPPIQTNNGGTYPFKLSEKLTQQLKTLAQKEDITLYTILLAAFQVLLYRYTSQEDILVGSPTFGRSKAEFAPIVGYFVDSVVMRADLSGNPCFRDFLSQVRYTVLEALAHQDYPFGLLVERLQPERDSSHSPIFQVSFLLQNFAQQESQDIRKFFLSSTKALDWGGLKVEPFILDQYESLFDLLLEIVEEESYLVGFLKYNTDLFDEQTIARMAGHFEALLTGIVSNPDQRVGQLPLLTDAQQHKLLGEWNNTAREYPEDKCMHQLFEEQVKQTPDAVAVIFGDQRLTYEELNKRANQLAHYLQSLEVSSEVLVGLCIDRSIEMLVGLLGILKAGGAYVPIDPTYPQQRLAYMLEDSAVPVLLTTESLLDILPKHQAKTVCLDSDWQAIASHSQENPGMGVTPENRAYVIYTSGSTGKPKGVEIYHQSLVNFLVSMNSYLKLTNLDTFNGITTISFDIAALELYLPLIVGASLALVPREIAIDGNRLLPQLLESGVTVMQATPATWKMLLTAGLSNHKLDMKLLSGGEALPAALAHQLLEIGKEVWNVYGPTEATIWSTIYKVGDRLQPTEDSHIITPIGRPISNTEIYILDSYLQPVPIGVSGELHIGGTGLASGYLNQPELTQEKFIPNPFESLQIQSQTSRLYKTGDLARYLPDGNIEYLGRIDNQVKIRGFRIELGEIESTLTKHPEVQEAVVISHPDRLNDKQLVAYVIPNFDHQSPSTQGVMNQSHSDQISLWQQVWDNTYKQTEVAQDPKFNIIGWRDSYTGLPIPEQEMRQWLDLTIERILCLKPERVLEIGCGTGMLLFQVAPHTTKYCGTDISDKAIFYIQHQLEKLQGNWSHVQLYNKPAHDFQSVDTETFDTVILNSVVQYFPSIEYLVGVLENAVKLVETGGAIFVGDVRSLRLLETFHTDILFSQAADDLTVEDLGQQVQKKLTGEEELVIEPAFFQALKQYLPQISQVEIQLKRGRANNEITKFRYDVILHVEKEILSPSCSPQLLNWQQEQLTLPSIQQILVEKQPEMLTIKDVPNARLQSQVKLKQLLTRKDEFVTLGGIRKALQEITLEKGIEPEDFWSLGDKVAYIIYITWSDIETNDYYDVVCWQKSSALIENRLPSLPREKFQQPKPWNVYSNNPLQSKLSQQLVPKLRNFLEQVLPKYMVPSAFLLLGALPLTPNGKVDRKKLPNPNIKNRSHAEYVVPKTATEQKIAKVWQDVLQLEKVGIYDNFFEVGGNSLLLVQVSSKLQELFKIEVQVIELLKYPTIYYLSQHIKGESISNNDSKEARNIRESNLKEGKSMMKQRLERRKKHRSRYQLRD
ncbi:non-ribosomal peptide synthetase [Okeania hirsuta]|uniref:MgiJ n=2 Tax=Okeania hirsuta TaxID=1458930 RepID=A0A3S8IFM5_9CYAN|nr:non-ribosomal peptide synthetase [Okeania hirsuta]AZH23822.1 MgiJ [Okeania hirsuta]RQH04066.1 MgiJ [Okeania hirsuta]